MFTLIAGLICWGIGYLVFARIYPFKKCRRCEGSPRLHSPSGKFWRMCRSCGGSGAKLRRASKWLRRETRSERMTL